MKNKIMAILLAITSAAIADDPKEAYDPYVLENAEEYNYYKKTAYAYAPATVYYEGQYHQFYCSTGGLTDMYYQPAAGNTYNSRVRFEESWDHVRYRTSKNGSVWSNPSIAITQAQNYPDSHYPSRLHDSPYKDYPSDKKYFFSTNAENCACDPAIVYGDDGYWYLFYAGNIDIYNTVVYVARSKNIQGPYEKYYGNNKWDRQALDPVPILKKYSPKNFLWKVGFVNLKTYHPANDAYYYGIGQVSVVKYSGKFHIWFAEMSSEFDNHSYAMRYHVAVDKVTDLEKVTLDSPNQSPIKIDVLTHDSNNGVDPSDNTHWHFSDFGEVRMSVSGKSGRFEMWVPNKYNDVGTSIIKYYSDNGIRWALDKSYEEGPYNYIHNIGVSGDKHGFVYDHKYLLSFSGPTSSLHRITSDMLANGYDNEKGGIDVTRGIWPMWQKLNNMQWSSKNVSYKNENDFGVDKKTAKKLTFFEGDFDGDGVYELGAVDLSSSKWYLRSSQNSNGKSSIWGKKFFTISGNFKIVYGDYDGDGITDFGVVTYEKKDGVWSGYWKVHSSKTNSFGVPHIPDNWEWYGLSKDLDLLNGDYDGDGIVDLVAFLPSTKTWYMISSRDGDFMSFQRITKTTKAPRVKLFGYTEEDVKGSIIPVVGDFDGDRIADMTLVDVDKNLWYIRSSQTGEPMMLSHKEEKADKSESWIPEKDWPRYMMRSVDSRGKPSNMNNVPSDMASYKFLPGDYDGDGITDQLVVKPTTGLGKMLLSRIKKSNVDGRKMMRLNAVRTESFPKAKNLTSKEFLVGDFDGNGYSDVCIVDTETYKYYIKFYGKNGSSKTTPYKGNIEYAKIPTSPSLAKAHSDEHDRPEVAPAKPLPNFNVNVQEGMVIVTNASVGQKVSLFDIRGKEISHKVSDGRDVSFATPAKGMYIVRVGKTQRKVTIK